MDIAERIDAYRESSVEGLPVPVLVGVQENAVVLQNQTIVTAIGTRITTSTQRSIARYN